MTYRSRTTDKLYQGYELIQKYKALRRKELLEAEHGTSETERVRIEG